jgi:hypothetical protein
MKKFEVKLHGENFLFDRDGEPGRFGFHAKRFVKAKDPEEAGKVAIILMHQNPVLQEALVHEGMSPPAIRLVQVKKANPFKYLFKKSAKDVDFYSQDEGESEAPL